MLTAPPRQLTRPLGALLLLFPLACRAALPEGPPTPQVVTEIHHRAGSLLSGPSPLGDPPDKGLEGVELFWRVSRVTDACLEHEGLERLGTRLRLVISPERADPLAPSPTLRFLGSCLIVSHGAVQDFLAQLEAGSFGPSLETTRLRSVVLPNSTTFLRSRSLRTILVAGEGALHRSVTFAVSSPPDGEFTLGLAAEDILVDGEAQSRPISAYAGDPRPLAYEKPGYIPEPVALEAQRLSEFVLLEDAPEVGAEPIVLVLPSPFEGEAGYSYVAEIRLISPPVPETGEASRVHTAMVARARREIEASIRDAARRTAPVNGQALAVSRLASAIQELAIDELRRSALLFLAHETGAEFARDLVFVASDEFLAQLLADVTDIEDLVRELGPQQLGWSFDQHSMGFMVELTEAGIELPGELTSVLIRHTGEVAHYPSLLSGAISIDRTEFERRLLEENRVFLESSSPASRVRSFDWLQSRGLAPQGYDPLADDDARRAALNAERQARLAAEEGEAR